MSLLQNQARVIAEAETRDFRWLNTGSIPKYEIESGAQPSLDEKNTAERLAQHGFKSRFRKTRDAEGLKTSDVFFVGGKRETAWDFKGPDGNGNQTVFHQFEEAAGQTSRVVIDFSKAGDKYSDNDCAERMTRRFIRYHYKIASGVDKGKSVQFEEALIVFKNGEIKRIAR